MTEEVSAEVLRAIDRIAAGDYDEVVSFDDGPEATEAGLLILCAEHDWASYGAPCPTCLGDPEAAAAIERAARALAVAQGFTSGDATVLQGMRSVPVWQTRVTQVHAVINALASHRMEVRCG